MVSHNQLEQGQGSMLPEAGYPPLTGSASRVESPRYRCPVASCHQIWYRHGLEETIPHCPIHDLQLVRDSKIIRGLTETDEG
jgi:hypothetical protein